MRRRAALLIALLALPLAAPLLRNAGGWPANLAPPGSVRDAAAGTLRLGWEWPDGSIVPARTDWTHAWDLRGCASGACAPTIGAAALAYSGTGLSVTANGLDYTGAGAGYAGVSQGSTSHPQTGWTIAVRLRMDGAGGSSAGRMLSNATDGSNYWAVWNRGSGVAPRLGARNVAYSSNITDWTKTLKTGDWLTVCVSQTMATIATSSGAESITPGTGSAAVVLRSALWLGYDFMTASRQWDGPIQWAGAWASTHSTADCQALEDAAAAGQPWAVAP